METHARLKILSDNKSAEDLNEYLGIGCDKSWRKGDLREHTTIKERKNGWILKSKLEKGENLDRHLSDLLGQVKHCGEKIKRVSEEDTVEVSCAIYSTDVPALYFEKETVKKFGELGASLDIDLYLLPEDKYR